MKKWPANYPKIFASLKQLKKDIDGLKNAESQAQRPPAQLDSDATRAAMGDVKTASAQIKTVVADLKSHVDGINKQIQFPSDLSRCPQRRLGLRLTSALSPATLPDDP